MQLVQCGTHGRLSGLVQQLLQVVDSENIDLLILVNQEVVQFFKEQPLQQQLDRQDKVLTQELFLVSIESRKVTGLYQEPLVPFIRAKNVSFSVTGMKPLTRVYPFFDKQNVTAFVTPTGGSLGGNLVTSASGFVSGVFRIPNPNRRGNPRFRTGERVFRLTSSATNATRSRTRNIFTINVFCNWYLKYGSRNNYCN